MKILVICQYYYPEPFRITDICEELVKRGNEVTVITGIPNYPEGVIYNGYRNGEKRNEIINGVCVHRCFTIGRRSGVLWRFLNYYSYAMSSSHYAVKIKNKFDVVFVNQLSPVMMANAGIKYKKKYGKKLFIYCLDLWPDSLTTGGIKKDSLIYKYYLKVSQNIYRSADKIFVTSMMFRDYLSEQFGLDKDAIDDLPQYAEGIFTVESSDIEQNKDTIDLMFAGNIGAAQSIQTIIQAASILKDHENIRWHIVGDGSELDNCKNLAADLKLKSVTFYGRKPLEEMPKFYAIADAMLVTMIDDPVLAMTLPGKVQGYMAAGKPIIGAINYETQKIIEQAKCGFCAHAGNEQELAQQVEAFSRLPLHDRKQMGENSRNFYNMNFRKDKFVDNLILGLSEGLM